MLSHLGKASVVHNMWGLLDSNASACGMRHSKGDRTMCTGELMLMTEAYTWEQDIHLA